MVNLFSNIPDNLPEEIFEDILSSEKMRIERIISHGHTSPDNGWYDQDENEWVLVLSGHGCIEFEGGRVITLYPGDHLNIPPHEKHKVKETACNEITIWLAVFYQP
ncbi:cupin [Vibrio albus]|uniref:Cupin n=1 Tax=Vibrio albus TaxID=2200953 RepID=A0A2U3B690_9VIBR|nr:cupin domain-containing protein [Vibrio albus]PWI32309.1 cupin [Vibrio albus]